MTHPGTEVDEVLERFEGALDPARPTASGDVEVLGFGEISVALRLAALPGLVCKRMSGFAGESDAAAYVDLVEEYLHLLALAGVRVAGTSSHVVRRPGRAPVVYLVQPELPADSLGHHILRTADDAGVMRAIEGALAPVIRLAEANRNARGVAVAVDGQLSNWSFRASGDGFEEPVLIDVGTPFIRHDGRHAIDLALLHRPIPPGIRGYYRWRGEVSAYLDDYFDPRLVAVDLLGNFHKEGRPDRIPLGVAIVNRWLAAHVGALGERPEVTAEEVERYYRKDADLLALYLRLRKGDRFLRTRVLRRPYDYVLPEHVAR